MKLLALTLTGLILPTTLAFAVTCPSVEAIKTQGLNMAVITNDNNWQAGWMPQSNYETNVAWRFAMGGKGAKDSADAMKLATEALKTLTFTMGPIVDDKATSCYYKSGAVNAIAVSPPDAM